MPFEVIGLHHTTLVVGDFDEARDFYGNILGLSSVDRPDYDFEGAWFKCGDVEFHLIVAEEHLAPSRRHLALAVNDFGACVEQLRKNGVRLVGGPGTRPHSGRSFAFCKDPSGNLMEITGPPT